MEQTSRLQNLSVLSNLVSKRKNEVLRPEAPVGSSKVANGNAAADNSSGESRFRSVADLSLGDNKRSGLPILDMNKALQGLVARKSSDVNASCSERWVEHTLPNFATFSLPGQMAPLDFTLKTSIRVVSSSPISWVHRSLMSHGYNGLHSNGPQLHSWVHPQSTLPPSLISVLTSTVAEGVEVDFLRRRLVAWDDSFQSLYYMLRNGTCICTPHFVVMFTARRGAGRTKRSCDAYISQSTRSLRALLKEHVKCCSLKSCPHRQVLLIDVCFSMPLCHSKIEQVTTEDLVELSEIEKQNLGKTRRLSSSSDIDYSPESLLAFSGNKNVHGLYDILLNYRSFLTSLMGMDVPVLYSPVPFRNAASYVPEIKCVALKSADHTPTSDKVPVKDCESTDGFASSGYCSSVEIKDAFIPPWIVCGICSLMGSEGKSFEASFMTEPSSITLNAALEAGDDNSDSQTAVSEGSNEVSYTFGITEAVVTPHLRSGLLKGLKYSNGSYTATRSSV